MAFCENQISVQIECGQELLSVATETSMQCTCLDITLHAYTVNMPQRHIDKKTNALAT